MKSATIIDREFGEITLLERSTARHLIFRIRYGSLSITHPRHTRIDAIQQSIEEKRDDLRKLFRRTEGRFLQPGDIIYTRTFVIMISCGDHHTISSRLHDNTLHIVLPQLTEYNDKNIQKSIAKHIQPHLKNAAENFLPQRLEYWAQKTGNSYKELIITRGSRRLGTCRSDRRISLSYHLMYLPDRLIDYVILHELSHLSEMNHSAKFHKICNRYCNGNELILRKELRNFPFPTNY